MATPEFSRSALQRNRRRWPYVHLLSATDGSLIIETVHGSLPSLRAEVLASAARIAGGVANRGGQVPGRIDVEGVTDEQVRDWIAAYTATIPKRKD